jgi:asparagine synthase (glutamine-hydrolysing)
MAKTPGAAIWAGMHEVEPGTVVTVDRNGLRSATYWRLETREHTDDQRTTVAHVRELLEDIVRRQLVADVPRCVLLSGGLDSSALTALAARQLGEQGETVRSFSVDFFGQTENYVADDLRPTPDAPFVRDVAEHVHSDHTDVMLNSDDLSDPALRRLVVTANDAPNGRGDMDASLYLLFKAIRAKSTVALSGESADEVFGGYRWFHTKEAQEANTFPWLTQFVAHRGDPGRAGGMFSSGLDKKLDLPGYLADRYATAVAEVTPLAGATEFENRMRVMSYLHLTRFVRMLLDRKDRMSMAVGLEVRVPFCDHRLVEYVYNTPWSLKTYDGREKSLLRGATADVLPRSVVERVKSPYPSTQDPKYPAMLQLQVKELLTEHDSPVFDVINREWLSSMVETEPSDGMGMSRFALERALDMAAWLDIYRPEVRTS